jgi:hypothetical protein
MFAILSNICSPIDLSLGDFLLLYELLEFIEFLTVFKLLVVPISIFFIMFMRFYYFFSPNRLAFFVSYRLSREERPGICGNLALLLRVNIYSFLIYPFTMRQDMKDRIAHQLTRTMIGNVSSPVNSYHRDTILLQY